VRVFFKARYSETERRFAARGRGFDWNRKRRGRQSQALSRPTNLGQGGFVAHNSYVGKEWVVPQKTRRAGLKPGVYKRREMEDGQADGLE
jgi:hypothetical protein